MSLTLNTNENNVIKFNIGVSGTSSIPSKVRVFIGDNNKKICFIAKRSEIEKEWYVEIPPIIDLLNYFSEKIFCTIEILVNGRTFIPYNKEIIINNEINSIPVSIEPQSKEPLEQEKIHIEENNDNVKFISKYKKNNIEYVLWYKGRNWYELTYSSKEGDKSLKFIKDWYNKSKEEIHDELLKDGYIQINENINTNQVKSLLKDKPIKEVFKKEKIKSKKSFKLKPFNDNKKLKINTDNKSLKDIMIIEDIDLSKISTSPKIELTKNSMPFKLIKKNIVYR